MIYTARGSADLDAVCKSVAADPDDAVLVTQDGDVSSPAVRHLGISQQVTHEDGTVHPEGTKSISIVPRAPEKTTVKLTGVNVRRQRIRIDRNLGYVVYGNIQ